jgi:hypothetical protein
MDGGPCSTSVSLFVMLNLVVRCTPSAPASYFLRAVGIKILKQVQDDGGVLGFRGGVGMTSRVGPSSRLRAFVRDTLAQRLHLAGRRGRALWARAHP